MSSPFSPDTPIELEATEFGGHGQGFRVMKDDVEIRERELTAGERIGLVYRSGDSAEPVDPLTGLDAITEDPQ